MRTLGIVLLIIGVVMTIITAVNYTTKEKVVDIGNLNITHDKPQQLNWSPIVGVVVIGIGGLIIWKSKN